MLLGAALTPLTCTAQAGQPTEYEVKAAFIHNIAKFVEWPAAARTNTIAKITAHHGSRPNSSRPPKTPIAAGWAGFTAPRIGPR